MILGRVKLRGFRGIKKGLGLDEVEVDLSGITGLVGLTGDNGAGKTTFLENLQPFRMMPSKKSSLYHQTFLRDSYKDISFWFEGAYYRTLTKIDSQAEKSEGYIWKSDKPQIVWEKKHSQVDGKVTNYDAYLVDLLGSANLFFNSIFCSQKAKKISGITTGKLKELFSEFLRLYELIANEDTSKQCVNVLDALKNNVEKEISILEDKAANKEGVEQELSEKSKLEGVLSKKSDQIAEEIGKLENELKAATEAISKNLIKKERLKDLDNGVKRLVREQDKEKDSVEDELGRLRLLLKGINDDHTECERLLADRGKIVKACKRESTILDRIFEIETYLTDTRKGIDDNELEIGLIERKIDEQRRIIDAGKNDPEITRLEAEIVFKREATAGLEKRSPTCKSEFEDEPEDVCSFIIGALNAQKELPVIEKNLSEQRKFIHGQTLKATEIVEKQDLRFRDLKEKQALSLSKRKSMRDEKLTLDKEIEQVRKLSSKRSSMDVAMSQKTSLDNRKAEVTDDGIRLRDKRDLAVSKIQNEIDKLNSDAVKLDAEISTELDDEKDKIELRTTELISLRETTNEQRSDNREKVAVLKQTIVEKIAAGKELAEKKTKLNAMAFEQSEWKYMRTACSKDGIQALEIDAVAPLITANANELLSMSFGGSDSVKFCTLDEENREVLDILVLRENAETVLLDNMCGGEEVKVLKSLRLAMTLISNEKSGKRYKTIFCDEEDGPLSVENAENFIQMYRSLMKIAGMDTCFYISHKPSCVALSDHRLNFERGGISVE